MTAPTSIQNYIAGAAIAQYVFVQFDSADHTVIQAAAADDLIIGISNILGAAAATDRVDVIKAGRAKLKLAGTVTRGAFITSDTIGEGVAAAAGEQYGAIAEQSGVDGDIIEVTIAFGMVDSDT